MEKLLERLKDEILVCDGAMGTMLIEKGMPQGASPEMWALENEKVLLFVHKAYIDAGADMLITNTFGANGIKLKRYKLQQKVEEINRRAVEAAKKAAKDTLYLLGDIGPTGEYLKPVGDLEPEEMLYAFAQQVKALADSGVDAIILETISDLEELKTAIMAVKENTKLPLIASMTFQRTAQGGFRTTSGISIPQFINDSLLSGCDAVGANCTIAIADMAELVSEMRKLSSAFLIAKPNAGVPKLIKDKAVYEQPIGEFKKFIPELIKSGANIIGGCCGTTPEHIRLIKEAVSRRQ